MKVYPRARLYEEMAFIAFYFHWGRDELMHLEHSERRRWCKELSEINRRMDTAPEITLDALN
ncbi:DUF6760 family protein [Paraburkholderia sp. RAU2J]|uniref:DUF6760 family protein n=1 Tax=Paraburkholderia sp. RAU2J TaxID=1938810 RepID=UPI000EB07DEB